MSARRDGSRFVTRVWYTDSNPSATTDTHGSNELRITVGHVWALEHCAATGILTATDYTFKTLDGRQTR